VRVRFPTAQAFGHTQAVAAREEFAGEGARDTFPEGVGGNADASRASQEAHWKGDSRRDLPACLFSFPNSLLAVGSWFTSS